MRISLAKSLGVPLIAALALGLSQACDGGPVYLAVGDSLTFGYDPSTPASSVPSSGDQGFVRPFADSLAARNGGVRPGVLNLGIVGELSTSFFTGQAPPGWTSRLPQLNLNYLGGTPAQNDRMIAAINAIHAAGNSVGYVSFAIGSNDIFYLVSTTAFQKALPADQQSMIAATIGTIQSNYLAVLNELKTRAPEAVILLPDYYNPYPSSVPQHAFYDSILAVFNPMVRSDAALFNADFVDLYPLFTGRELALTNIAMGDVHPNQDGYALIAGALIQAVPEPTSLSMLAVGVVGLLAWGRRAMR